MQLAIHNNGKMLTADLQSSVIQWQKSLVKKKPSYLNIRKHCWTYAVVSDLNLQFAIAFDPLPNSKYLDWSKLKAFAEEKINVTYTEIFFIWNC